MSSGHQMESGLPCRLMPSAAMPDRGQGEGTDVPSLESVSAFTVLDDGRVAMVLDVPWLVTDATRQPRGTGEVVMFDREAGGQA